MWSVAGERRNLVNKRQSILVSSKITFGALLSPSYPLAWICLLSKGKKPLPTLLPLMSYMVEEMGGWHEAAGQTGRRFLQALGMGLYES